MRFLDRDGNPIHPLPKTLPLIYSIDTEHFDGRTKRLSVSLYEDVKNPLLGPNGATYCFAPQKGADKKSLPYLEKGMEHLSKLYFELSGEDHSGNQRTGACGGLPMAFLNFFPTHLLSGSSYFLSRKEIENALLQSDFLFTGEGRVDSTSFEGKGSLVILKKAKEIHPGMKTVLLVGSIEEEARKRLRKEIPNLLILPMCENAMSYPIEKRKKKAEEIFRRTIKWNLPRIQDMIKSQVLQL